MNVVGEDSALNSTPQKRGEIEDSSVNISLEVFVVWENTVQMFHIVFDLACPILPRSGETVAASCPFIEVNSGNPATPTRTGSGRNRTV
jgi:hypothetical protein